MGAKVVEERTVVSERKEVVKQRIDLQMLQTGNEAFDCWLGNIRLHGFKNRHFHALQLGVEVPVMNAVVLASTGMLYADFVRELTYVVALDLIREKNYRFLNQVAEFLGYKAYSSLFRLIKHYEESSPTGQKRMSPEEQMKQLEEIKKRYKQ